MPEISAIDADVHFGKNIASEFCMPCNSYILAICDSQIIGYIRYSYAEKNVFINSIAVSPEFQRQEIGKNLLLRLFAFLSKESQCDNKQIQNVYSYALTEEGKTFFSKANFTKLKKEHGGKPLMRYTLDNFSETNMYLFVPFFVNGELESANLTRIDEEDNSYLEQLNHISNREFSSFSAEMKRCFIAKEKFIIVDEEDEKVLCDDRECKIYLTAYRNFYVATIAFKNLGYEPTAVIHQAAGNMLYISVDGEKISFSVYLAKYFNLKYSCAVRCVNMTGKARCFRQAYNVKCFTTLTVKPLESHLEHMLSCDCYGTGGMDEIVTSSVFFEKARRNLEEHQFTQIYASEKSVVYVLTNPPKDRLLHESRMIFVIELLSLQICAFNSNYEEIVNGLDKREFSRQTIENVNFRYSRAAKLWDINNFRFLPAKNVFGVLTNEFGIPKLKDELNENLNIFEKMTAMDLQKRMEQHSKSSKVLLTVFSVLAGIVALSSMVNLFYKAIVEKSSESTISLIICGIALWLMAMLSFILVSHRKRDSLHEKDAKCRANRKRK